jgi:hypothetical protein
MTASINQRLEAIREASMCVDSIIVTDRDGVEVISLPSQTLSSTDKRQNTQILSTIFTLTHEQCAKLSEFKSARYIISEFGDSRVLLQSHNAPVVITIEADRRKASDAKLIEVLRQVSKELSVIRQL